jgi:G3E family GTPase
VFLANWRAPIPWADLGDWLEDLAGFCGDRLLRVKGLVPVVGVSEPILIDGVGTTFAEPRRIGSGPSGGKGLVIIARDIDLAELATFSMAYAAGVRPDLRNSSKRAA